jgi:hypothetical protein
MRKRLTDNAQSILYKLLIISSFFSTPLLAQERFPDGKKIPEWFSTSGKGIS